MSYCGKPAFTADVVVTFSRWPAVANYRCPAAN
jgi:hypothetical protein